MSTVIEKSLTDIIGQARALQASSRLNQLDFDIDDMLKNESLHIDARGLPGMFFDLEKRKLFSIKKVKNEKIDLFCKSLKLVAARMSNQCGIGTSLNTATSFNHGNGEVNF